MQKLGNIVRGKLIEAIDDRHWIVSFNGKLVQVVNSSPLEFEKNKLVYLRVTREKPLELSLSVKNDSFYRPSIDLKV